MGSMTQPVEKKSYLVTDSTDIALALQSGAGSNVGSAFSANIPPNGVIRMASFSGRILAGATAAKIYWGIKIASVNYWFGKTNLNGVVAYSEAMRVAISAYSETDGTMHDGSSTGPFLDLALDVAGAAIPTGAQTVQLICGYATGSATLKGTVKQTRVALEIEG